ncbi:MAG: single-stranded DNA-binding protein [Oscillospiraceae bacterium]|nr:single-stranded DNA-binding protein [Oscillospiraceae bacterium]
MHTYQPFHFNRARLCGTVMTDPAVSHANHGEEFCRFFLSVQRLSGQADLLPVVVSRRTLTENPIQVGDTVTVQGQLRSFNNKSGVGARLVIDLFARSVTAGGEYCNHIELSGTVCKAPTLRRTPLGREICDVILAVNRRYGRADYLPCISWGTIARETAALTVGSPMALVGRLQSRTYSKALEGGCEERIAYEVSVMRPAEPQEFFFV